MCVTNFNIFQNTVVLREYFHSWRPYKLILARLREVHGLDRRFLSLKRCIRCSYVFIHPLQSFVAKEAI